eukprot:CAMPEP_0171700482 /NCGR_PEP_ID=MMETSP0991-20121206/10549_1 /TAXON_ID=483369 /ORGANISM="non described non described, Strain CCMP2098" /LENGTH=89 /DNA_ID=CAMNT_0012289687 /DNA_START=218 /DNA_END=487 /DNA_ORIENTATION=+
MVTVAEVPMYKPPPQIGAVFLEMVQSVMVTVADSMYRPPPRSAVLSEMVHKVMATTVADELIKRPPPAAGSEPLVMVRSLKDTPAPLVM